MEKTQIKVTAKDKEIFDRDGYWISPKLIDDDQIARLREAHERIWSGDYDGAGWPMNWWAPATDPNRLRKLDNGWWINDEVHKAVTDPLIGELAADLLDENEIKLWHDQVIYKPGVGDQDTNVGNVGWHQDFGYWQSSSTPNMVTVWIALQDTDLTNGGMMTICGSHKWGLVPDSGAFFDPDLQGLKDRFGKDREWREEPCILKAGQASFHHALTFHGSGPNRTSEPRMSIVAHLMPGHTTYRAQVMRHDNVRFLGPRPRDGQSFAGDYWPVLFSR